MLERDPAALQEHQAGDTIAREIVGEIEIGSLRAHHQVLQLNISPRQLLNRPTPVNDASGESPVGFSKQAQLSIRKQLARIRFAGFGDFPRRVVRTSAAHFGVTMQG